MAKIITLSDEEKLYRDSVESAFKLQSSYSFGNNNKSHCRVLLTAMFDRAKREAFVISRCLSSDIEKVEDSVWEWPPLVESIEAFLRRSSNGYSSKLYIILKEARQLKEGHSLLPLKSKYPENLIMATAGSNSEVQFKPSMAVYDSRSFRAEKNSDADNYAAKACLNDPNTASELRSKFVSAWNDQTTELI